MTYDECATVIEIAFTFGLAITGFMYLIGFGLEGGE